MKTSKPIALIITILFVGLSFLLVMYVFESPIRPEKHHDKKYAAITIRDNVSSFEKFGTRLFTIPYLNKHYNQVVYHTEGYKEEKRENFISDLTTLLNQYDSVDIFLLAHGNYYYVWLQEISHDLRKKIRLVYNTACSGSMQEEEWKRLGVNKYVAHKSQVSASPLFYFYFLRRYCNGYPLEKAVNESNQQMHTRLCRLKMITLGYAIMDPVVERESEGKILFKQ